MSRPAIIASASELLGIWPDLDDVAVVGLDLRDAPLDWSAARVRSHDVPGLPAPRRRERPARARGAVVLSRFRDAAVRAVPSGPLHLRRAHGGPRARRSRDARCADRRVVHRLVDVAARRRRSARCTTRRSMRRSPASSTAAESSASWAGTRSLATPIGTGRVAELGRALTRAGFTVATGGGPGVMEAANLGAWMAPSPTTRLDDALAILACAPDAAARSPTPTCRPRSTSGIGGRTAARVSACRRGCISTSRPPASRRTSRSTSRTASAKTACSRSHAPASCTRPAAPAPNRRSSPTPRRTASRSTRCAARWSSSAATSSTTQHPELLAAVRRQAGTFGVARPRSPCADKPDEAVAFIARARPGRRRARAASSAAASIRRSDHAVADRPRARTALALRGSLRAHPGRVRGPGRVSPEVDAEAAAVASARSGAAARRARPPIGSTRATCRSSRSIRRNPGPRPGVPRRTHARTAIRVRYAIADVAAFVAPGGALDRESFVRGVTLYLPDGRAPMLPNQLGEGAASLLPDEERPALLWTIDLDATGATTSARLERATVRSRARLDYPSVQADARPRRRRRAARPPARDRRASTRSRSRTRWHQPRPPHAGSDRRRRGRVPRSSTRRPLPVEAWNAQISLLAGMEAARIMVDAGVGILRTLPPPPAAAHRPPAPHRPRARRRVARGRASWADVVRGLDRTRPDDAAFLIQAAHVLRGAGYAKLDAVEHCRRGAGADPRRRRRAVRARDRAVAPPRRPLRERDRARALRGCGAARLGRGRARRARHDDGTAMPRGAQRSSAPWSTRSSARCSAPRSAHGSTASSSTRTPTASSSSCDDPPSSRR